MWFIFRVCGSVYCRQCCKNDLLLFFNEDDKACAKLIGVVGCPDEEPKVALYLPLCVLCHDDLEEYQVWNIICKWSIKTSMLTFKWNVYGYLYMYWLSYGAKCIITKLLLFSSAFRWVKPCKYKKIEENFSYLTRVTCDNWFTV